MAFTNTRALVLSVQPADCSRERSDVGKTAWRLMETLQPRRREGEFKDAPIVGPLSGCQAHRHDRTMGGADGGFGGKTCGIKGHLTPFFSSVTPGETVTGLIGSR